jgi:hypothetical protein
MIFEWLVLKFAFEFGFLPQGEIRQFNVDQSYQSTMLNLDMYLDFQTELVFFDMFYIGGDAKIFIVKRADNFYEFNPTSLGSLFFAGIKYNFDSDSSIDFGLRHYCQHPIIPYMYNSKPSILWEGFYEEIYLRFEGKIK